MEWKKSHLQCLTDSLCLKISSWFVYFLGSSLSNQKLHLGETLLPYFWFKAVKYVIEFEVFVIVPKVKVRSYKLTKGDNSAHLIVNMPEIGFSQTVVKFLLADFRHHCRDFGSQYGD